MTLRAAEASDLADIMQLERVSFPTDAWSEPMMQGELASPHGRYLVDIEAGGIVGYGGVRAVAGAADAGTAAGATPLPRAAACAALISAFACRISSRRA